LSLWLHLEREREKIISVGLDEELDMKAAPALGFTWGRGSRPVAAMLECSMMA
jgi:hypothetical protein